MLPITVRLHVAILLVTQRVEARLAQMGDEEGQTSAEYALVLLGAATVAMIITLWAKNTDKVGGLLDSIFDRIASMKS